MRYNNKEYVIESRNLNNSLAFYRALFNRMPLRLDTQSMTYQLRDFKLTVLETSPVVPTDQPLLLPISVEELVEVNERMRRFRAVASLKNDCEVLERAIGLIDPDGNKWVVGEPHEEVHFEKCYINF